MNVSIHTMQSVIGGPPPLLLRSPGDSIPQSPSKAYLSLSNTVTSDLSGQVNFPEPEASSGHECNRVKGRRCWEATGLARTIFLNALPRLDEALFQRQDEILAGCRTRPARHLEIYMIGRSAALARPTVLYCCRKRSVRKSAVRVISESKILPPYVKLGSAEHVPIPVALSPIGIIHVTCEMHRRASSGLNFWVVEKEGVPSRQRQATIGGALLLDGKPYWLTAAHVFDMSNGCEETLDTESSNSSEDFDGSWSDEDIEDPVSRPTKKFIATSSPVVSIVENMAEPGKTRNAIQSPLGILWKTSLEEDDGVLDWALIKTDINPVLNTSSMKVAKEAIENFEPLALQVKISEELIDSKVTIFTSHGPVRGYLVATPSLFYMAGAFRPSTVWHIILENKIGYGDSGSWVVNDSLQVYGHVIAASADGLTAFIISMKHIIEDICGFVNSKTEPSSIRAMLVWSATMQTEITEALAGIEVIDEATSRYLAAQSHRRENPDWTALHLAGQERDASLTALLIDAGADVNARNSKQWTPLHQAAQDGHTEVAQALISAGADVNAQQDDGATALHLAAQGGHQDVATVLIEAGARVDTATRDGRTALFTAVGNGKRGIVKLLITSGADLAAVEEDNWTTLHFTGQTGDKLPSMATGLQVLYPGNENSEASVDIIFVHGLGGHLERTWSPGTGSRPWPRTLLPQDLPNARVLSFGYDIRPHKRFGHSENRDGPISRNQIGEHASNLAQRLCIEREHCELRPIIFVAHSLGGLVVEQMINNTHHHVEEHLQKIGQSVIGICFMGTPHHGSDHAAWGQTAARILNFTRTTSTNPDLLGVLVPGSEMLGLIEMRFGQILRIRENHRDRASGPPISITCFAEEFPVYISGAPFMIVEQNSARLPGYQLLTIPADHFTMVKFASRDEDGYVAIRGEISRWLRQLNAGAIADIPVQSTYGPPAKPTNQAYTAYLAQPSHEPQLHSNIPSSARLQPLNDYRYLHGLSNSLPDAQLYPLMAHSPFQQSLFSPQMSRKVTPVQTSYDESENNDSSENAIRQAGLRLCQMQRDLRHPNGRISLANFKEIILAFDRAIQDALYEQAQFVNQASLPRAQGILDLLQYPVNGEFWLDLKGRLKMRMLDYTLMRQQFYPRENSAAGSPIFGGFDAENLVVNLGRITR